MSSLHILFLDQIEFPLPNVHKKFSILLNKNTQILILTLTLFMFIMKPAAASPESN